MRRVEFQNQNTHNRTRKQFENLTRPDFANYDDFNNWKKIE